MNVSFAWLRRSDIVKAIRLSDLVARVLVDGDHCLVFRADVLRVNCDAPVVRRSIEI